MSPQCDIYTIGSVRNAVKGSNAGATIERLPEGSKGQLLRKLLGDDELVPPFQSGCGADMWRKCYPKAHAFLRNCLKQTLLFQRTFRLEISRTSVMAAKVPARSILKQPTQSTASSVTDEQKAQAEKNRRHLNIALQHAYVIQHQKDVQAQTLKNIETLLDLPTETPASPPDIHTFLSLAQLFQPSNFDELVEERRVDGKCGYALCSNQRRAVTFGPNQAWKLRKGQADWCSNACAKKALYIKAQLSEVPAWEREPGQQPSMQLHEDDRNLLSDQPAGKLLGHSSSGRAQQQLSNHNELAAERGEKATSFRPNQVMTDNIVEKPSLSRHPVSSKENVKVELGSATAIEGYEPSQSTGKARNRKPDSTTNSHEYVDSDDGENEDDEIAGGIDGLVTGPSAPGEMRYVEGQEESDSWKDLFESMDAQHQFQT